MKGHYGCFSITTSVSTTQKKYMKNLNVFVRMVDVETPAKSVFMGLGHEQQTSDSWSEGNAL